MISDERDLRRTKSQKHQTSLAPEGRRPKRGPPDLRVRDQGGCPGRAGRPRAMDTPSRRGQRNYSITVPSFQETDFLHATYAQPLRSIGRTLISNMPPVLNRRGALEEPAWKNQLGRDPLALDRCPRHRPGHLPARRLAGQAAWAQHADPLAGVTIHGFLCGLLNSRNRRRPPTRVAGLETIDEHRRPLEGSDVDHRVAGETPLIGGRRPRCDATVDGGAGGG